jgi:hypothetical protein
MTFICDDCGERTWGGPILHTELWASIAWDVGYDPEEPDLFSLAGVPSFRRVGVLCFGCMERRLGRRLTQGDIGLNIWNVEAGWIDLNERNLWAPEDPAKPLDDIRTP